MLRITFRHFLEEAGHEVLDAEDGLDGVRVCRETQPDLVITDMVMPRQEGAVTVAILAREFPGMPVIAMSGASVGAPREWLEPGGHIKYVAKPVTRPALLDMVNKLLLDN